ncbi:MAG: hypothetical protein JW760_13000 [Spirochaetales bacterium]|nr:hypothetical protein [Spirochaetales bacterium]
MTALLIGILFILFAVFAVLPGSPVGLGWWEEVLLVLKGGIPLLAVFIGFLAVLIGLAELKDRMEEKKEKPESEQEDNSGQTDGMAP